MVDDFIRKAKDLFLGGNQDQQDADYRDRQVSPASEDSYGDPASQNEYGAIPASQDPYGDPADHPDQFPDVRPASEDPYGDPGDVRPASEDPYGDPADQGY